MIYLAPFKIEHFDEILPRLRSIDAISLQGFDLKDYRKSIEAHVEDAPIATWMCNNEVAAVGGGIRMWDGVATYWMLTSPLVDQHKLSFHRACKEGLNFLTETFEIHRLEASIAEHHYKSQRWAEALGFKNEGLMMAYGPDRSNHYRYARVVT